MDIISSKTFKIINSLWVVFFIMIIIMQDQIESSYYLILTGLGLGFIFGTLDGLYILKFKVLAIKSSNARIISILLWLLNIIGIIIVRLSLLRTTENNKAFIIMITIVITIFIIYFICIRRKHMRA